MKKLGRYPDEVGYRYHKLLNESGIHCDVIDTSNVHSQYASKGHIFVELLVEPSDYDRAKEVINNFEYEAKQRVDLLERNIRDNIKNFISYGILLGLIAYIIYFFMNR